jgi:pilus assembly protein CpaF
MSSALLAQTLRISGPKGFAQDVALGKNRLSVGKAEDCDICLGGWSVAKKHAVFIVDEGDVFVEDMGGFFGTYIDNERIVRFGPLEPNHEVIIGAYKFSLAGGATETALLENTLEPPQPHHQPSSVSVQALDAPVAVIQKSEPQEQEAAKEQEAPQAKRSERSAAEDDLVFRWRTELHATLLDEMESRRIDVNRMKDNELRANVRTLINDIIARTPQIAQEVTNLPELAQMVLDEAIGLGPLEALLRDDTVSEIMVNGYNDIWVEQKGKLSRSAMGFTSDKTVLGVIERIVTPLGRRIDESSPLVDARLKDGSRVNAIIPPLALKGPSVTIRKFSRKKLGAEQFVSLGSLTPEMVEVLRQAVLYHRNIVVSGGTGTGKTTFLNMLSSFIPDDERIVTIEDAAELVLNQPNLVSLESRPQNSEGKGQITIRDLVRNSLRMRPDRIVIGECRGGEALDMLQAMNTGHDGSLTTLHANTPRDALSRLEVLVTMAGTNLPTMTIRQQIASAVHLIIQLTRFSCGARKISSITEIVGMEGDTIQLQEIFAFRQTARSETGKTIGHHEATDAIPDFYTEMKTNGLPVDINIFNKA